MINYYRSARGGGGSDGADGGGGGGFDMGGVIQMIGGTVSSDIISGGSLTSPTFKV